MGVVLLDLKGVKVGSGIDITIPGCHSQSNIYGMRHDTGPSCHFAPTVSILGYEAGKIICNTNHA